MSLRLKLILGAVLLAVSTTAAIGVLSYRSTSSELRHSIDSSLEAVAARLDHVDPPRGDGNRGPGGFERDLERVLVQVLRSNGEVVQTPQSGELPVDDIDREVADAEASRELRDVFVDGDRYRMLTVGVPGGAVQLARSLEEVEHIAHDIRERTMWIGLIVGVLAALVGWLLANQLTRRLTQLTSAASNVAATGRLDVAVPEHGTDETGRLASAFNAMLTALAQSKASQHQLVQDAGHELRTPLTSLRTNVSVLQRYGALPDEQRTQVLADIESETRELSDLVNELVELATDRRNEEAVAELSLGDIVEAAADRVRRRTGRDVTVRADDSRVDGRAMALDRAVHNLIDNAAKFTDEGTVDVTVAGGRVAVADRGPGLNDSDIPKLFDRFYRADAARSRPGSGLGLAIVREIVTAHNGHVFAENRDGGGAVVGFRLPSAVGVRPPAGQSTPD